MPLFMVLARDLKFTLGKIVQLGNVQHVPTMNKNLVSGSLLCRDGFKLVLESNKVAVSKHGQFIGKGYGCGGLFCFSLSDFCNKFVNHICGGVNDHTSVWHSRLCHINFGLMCRLSSMSLIPKFTIAKVVSVIVVCNRSNLVILIWRSRRETWHL
jgi:hypothetical protein